MTYDIDLFPEQEPKRKAQIKRLEKAYKLLLMARKSGHLRDDIRGRVSAACWHLEDAFERQAAHDAKPKIRI